MEDRTGGLRPPSAQIASRRRLPLGFAEFLLFYLRRLAGQRYVATFGDCLRMAVNLACLTAFNGQVPTEFALESK